MRASKLPLAATAAGLLSLTLVSTAIGQDVFVFEYDREELQSAYSRDQLERRLEREVKQYCERHGERGAYVGREQRDCETSVFEQARPQLHGRHTAQDGEQTPYTVF